MSEIAEKFSRITPIPAYQMVAEAIEREILSGRLRPGDPIGTEAELVRQFGVNRSTVREGIRAFAKDLGSLRAMIDKELKAAA